MTPKRKSQKRFEQANDLCDRIGPSLPTPTHFAVLFVAWRHATNGRFRVSATQVSKAISGSTRNVRRVLDDLEQGGVITLMAEKKGTIPRTYKFSGKSFNEKPRGDTMSSLSQNASGDKYDT